MHSHRWPSLENPPSAHKSKDPENQGQPTVTVTVSVKSKLSCHLSPLVPALLQAWHSQQLWLTQCGQVVPEDKVKKQKRTICFSPTANTTLPKSLLGWKEGGGQEWRRLNFRSINFDQLDYFFFSFWIEIVLVIWSIYRNISYLRISGKIMEWSEF